MSANLADFAPWPAMSGIVGIVYCDTAADLPAVNAFSQGNLVQGSKAKDIDTGDEYMMNSSGTWIKQPAPNTTQLSLTDYYTSAEVDAAIAAALASYTNTSDMTTAINTAIMSTQYINRGTEITALGADLNDLETCGKYFTAAYATACTNLPSDFSGLAFTLVVETTTTTTGTRLRQTLKPAAAPSNVPIPKMWVRYKTGSGSGEWRAWTVFEGANL